MSSVGVHAGDTANCAAFARIMGRMLLAADIGGTKTLVGLFREAGERPDAQIVREYATLDFDSLDEIIAAFLEETGTRSCRCGLHRRRRSGVWPDRSADERAVARRRLGRRRSSSRLPDPSPQRSRGHGVFRARAEAEELAVVQEGLAVPTGNAALIAAGTGLGEALLHYVGGRFIPSPTEGGHADFAARTPRRGRAAPASGGVSAGPTTSTSSRARA